MAARQGKLYPALKRVLAVLIWHKKKGRPSSLCSQSSAIM